MGKLLPVQRTVWILRMRRKCTALHAIGETTKPVPNKPLIYFPDILPDRMSGNRNARRFVLQYKSETLKEKEWYVRDSGEHLKHFYFMR